MGTYAHNTHIDNATSVGYQMGCEECHAATVSDNTTVSDFAYHVDKGVNVEFDNNINKDSDSPDYNGSTTGAGGSSVTPGAGPYTCANVFCHSEGNIGSGATNTFKSIAWNAGDIGCDGCHGGDGKTHPTYANGGAGNDNANNHDVHVDGASAYGCDVCHEATVTQVSNRPTAVITPGAHLNSVEDVVFKSYGGLTGVYQGDKGCDNTYCHGTTGPQWGAGALGCDGCHDADNSGGLALRHDVHYNTPTAATSLGTANTPTATAYVFGCGNCHPDNSTHAKGPWDQGNNQPAEVNGVMITDANYTQGVTNDVDSFGFDYTIEGTCDNSYCHSDGKGTYAAPQWNDPLTGPVCDICHQDADGGGAASWTAPHNAHMVGNYQARTDITCNSCHYGVAIDNSSIGGMANHINGGPIDVGFSAFADNGGATWSDPQCSNTYCHSDGKASATSVNVDWSGNTGCVTCHDDTGASTTLSAAHSTHLDASNYQYSCDDCHGVMMTGDSTITDYLKHVDGSRDVDSGRGFNGTSCTTTDCHSTGNRISSRANSGTSNITQTWAGSITDCTACHEFADTQANMHAASPGMSNTHIIHIGNGTGGYGSAARGAYKITCDDCHHGTTDDGLTIRTDGIGNHVNSGNANVIFSLADWTDSDNAGYATGTYTCTNVYCHSLGDEFPPTVYNSVSWNDGPLGCDGCHGNPPTGHKGNPNECEDCHGHVTDGTPMTFSDITLHINHNVEGGGEATGGSDCDGCHFDQYKRMNMLTPNVIYKHYINGATASYPTSDSPSMSADDRGCLMCHVDHDIFRPDVNTGVGNRAFNMRTSITTVPTQSTGWTDSDFDTTGGGICMSCHYQQQTKAVATNDGVQYMPALPTVNVGSLSNAVEMFQNSSHNYSVTSGAFTDTTVINITCLKCHNDTLDLNADAPGYQKSNVLDNAGAVVTEPRFGLHASANNNYLAPMGMDSSARRDFVQGKVISYNQPSLYLSNSIDKDYTGYVVVVTKNDGSDATRVKITNTNTTNNWVNAVGWGFTPSATAGSEDFFEITRNITSADEVCFNCHSVPADGFKSTTGKDYYGTSDLSAKMEAMYGLFIGDSGSLKTAIGGGKSNYTAVMCTTSTWGADVFSGYQVAIGSFSGTISANTATTGGSGNCAGQNEMSLTVSPSMANLGAGSSINILKPSSHPLDKLGRHTVDEPVNATAGKPTTLTDAWNAGDTGKCVSASTSQCDDVGKNWTTNSFDELDITFSSGSCIDRSFAISSNAYNTVSYTATGCTPTDGDTYFVGNRHVSCGDCHNTHSARRKPAKEGTIANDSDDIYVTTTTLEDSSKTTANTNWVTDTFKTYLIIVTTKNGTYPGFRQVRQISGSSTDGTKTTYTVSIPFDGWESATSVAYEVGKFDGSTGPGGKGTWGVRVTGWTTGGQDPSTFTYTKVYDTGGDVGGMQYEQCLRCHSYYSFQDAFPVTTSGHADGSAVLSTDVAYEINPYNKATHAIVEPGVNQPITSTGSYHTMMKYGSSQFWSYVESTGSITDNGTDATVTGYGTNIPSSALPGWYAGVTTDQWYQITEILSSTSFKIAETDGNPWDSGKDYTGVTGSRTIRVTAGLGETFVPPYGPWSIIRCTECHGSTLSDPLGPHASVNKWMLKSLDTSLSFQWFDGTSVVRRDPNNSGAPTTTDLTDSTLPNYFCYNCHARDVYYDENQLMPADTYALLSRVAHGSSTQRLEGGHNAYAGALVNYTYWGVNCRNCHAGEDIGVIHGSNGTSSERFLNGASWGGASVDNASVRATITTTGSCYADGSNPEVNVCSSHSGGTSYGTTATYDYQ
jgi:predicted CxxxxCH...CXXCH cytochrome family protein